MKDTDTLYSFSCILKEYKSFNPAKFDKVGIQNKLDLLQIHIGYKLGSELDILNFLF